MLEWMERLHINFTVLFWDSLYCMEVLDLWIDTDLPVARIIVSDPG